MIADHYNVTTDYLLGRSEARRPENNLIVTKLGLTDESIATIRFCRDAAITMPARDGFLLASPLISLLDVFNRFINQKHFLNLLDKIGMLTNPAIDTLPRISEVVNENGEGYPVKTFYRQVAHDTLDEIIESMTEQNEADMASLKEK